MMDKLSALTVIQVPIAKQKDYLHRLVLVTEDISAYEGVILQLQQTQILEEYVKGDNTVLLDLHLLEIAHLVHFVVQHN